MSKENAYSILNVRKGADDAQIKSSYLSLVKRYDPERHTDRFMVIQKAYEQLADPVKRAREDILTYNPAKGRWDFLPGEKTELPESDIDERIAQLEKALGDGQGSEEQYQELALALMQKSAVCIRRRLLQEAIKYWERILKFDPTHQRAKNNLIFAYSYLAYSYADNELAEDAIDLWIKASVMNPDDDDILHNVALACESVGRKEESERYWAETLRRWKARLDRDPDDSYTRSCILEVHRHHGGKSLRQAPAPEGEAAPHRSVESYKEILKIDPDDFEAQYQLAADRMEQHEFAEAAELLKKMLKKYTRNVEVMNVLGWALLNSGQIDAGFHMWRLSLKIDPKSSATRDSIMRAHLELGKKCRDQGQYNSALKHFKSLLKLLGPRNPEVHFEIATTYYLKGDKRSAYVAYQTVLKLDPRNQAAKRALQDMRLR
jgi:tetratricopeptide (TPR) repeat protein